MDKTMAHEEIITNGKVNAKIHPGGRGYVKLVDRDIIYSKIYRITVIDLPDDVKEV